MAARAPPASGGGGRQEDDAPMAAGEEEATAAAGEGRVLEEGEEPKEIGKFDGNSMEEVLAQLRAAGKQTHDLFLLCAQCCSVLVWVFADQ